MEKCAVCGGKRARRDCPVKGRICPVCCGTKRRAAIDCPDGCAILAGPEEGRLAREVRTEITDRIGKEFRTRKDEILDKPGVEEFARGFEEYLIKYFYGDGSVSDGDIRSALEMIYAHRTGKVGKPVIRNRVEELVFGAWEKAVRDHPALPEETRTAVLVRIVKSIRESSGGFRGAHGYLDMLHDDFGLRGRVPAEGGAEGAGGDGNADAEIAGDEDLFDVRGAPVPDGKGARDLLYHMRTRNCPYTAGPCTPEGCMYGDRAMELCPVHIGERS